MFDTYLAFTLEDAKVKKVDFHENAQSKKKNVLIQCPFKQHKIISKNSITALNVLDV